MNNYYQPDRWLILKITTSSGTLYKVFATWGGGYLSGDSWRLNSGISSFTKDEDYFYFHSDSGSVYACYKGSYGVVGSSNYIILDKLTGIKKKEGVSVECLSYEEAKREFERQCPE